MYLPILHPEIEELQHRIKLLQKKLNQLLIERDDLCLLEARNVEVEYQVLFGSLQNVLYETRTLSLRLRRKISLMRSVLNRNEVPDEEWIEQQLDLEMEEYHVRLEQMQQKYEWALQFHHLAKPLKKEEIQELKHLYFRLLKVLHPDLNPEADPALLQKAMMAYQNGNLEDLKTISLSLTQSRESSSDLPGLRKKAETLAIKIREIHEEMIQARKSLPLSLRPYLKEPERSEHRKALENLLQSYKEQKEYYEQEIEQFQHPPVFH